MKTSRDIVPFKKHPRLLVAHSDHDFNHELVVELRRCSFFVHAADCGISSLDKLELFTPDLILLDVHLMWGGADGVLDILESESRLALTPVMLLAPTYKYPFELLARFDIVDVLEHPAPAQHIAENCLDFFDWSETQPNCNAKRSIRSRKVIQHQDAFDDADFTLTLKS